MEALCETTARWMSVFIWSDIVSAAFNFLPIIALAIVGFILFRFDEDSISLKDLRIPFLILIPWAIAETINTTWFLICFRQ